MKRTIAFILTICMIITCFSGAVIAKETNSSVPSNTTSTIKDDDYSDKDTSDKDEPDQEYSNNDEEDKDISTSSSDTIDSINYPEFNPEPVIIDGVAINVFAPEGVFPEGANLVVKEVSDESKKAVDEAVDKLQSDNTTIAKSYTFDIKIMAKDGVTELEPKDSKKVNVFFTSSYVSDVNLDTRVYHIVDSNLEDNEETLKAEELSVIEDDGSVAYEDNASLRDATLDENTAVVETESFSYYTVNFTYSAKNYYMYGTDKISVDDVRDKVGLSGEVTLAESSDDSKLEVSEDNGEYYVKPLVDFDGNVTLTVTINGTPYNIAITKAAKTNSSLITVNSWSDLKSAVNDCSNGAVIILGDNITASGSDRQIRLKSEKSVIIDLNGKKLNRNLSKNDDDGHVFQVEKGTLTIRDSSGDNSGIITGAYENTGGAINIYENATVIIEGGTISGNTSDDDGGAIYNKGYLKMTGGVIRGNHANETGGAIYCADANAHFDISNVVIRDNYAKDYGGAFNIHLKDTSSLTNCTIENNESKSDYAGAIYMNASGRILTITDCHIDKNKSDDDGGAIYLQAGTINMFGGTVNENKSDNDSGAVKVTYDTYFNATGTEFNENIADTEEGGAIKNFGVTELDGCTISYNTAVKEGGAIYSDKDSGDNSGKLELTNCTLTGNYSAKKGGAIYSDHKLKIDGGTFNDNSTRGTGGAIFVGGDSKDVEIQGEDSSLKIKYNSAEEDGNNIYLRDGRKLKMTGTLAAESEIWLTMENETGTAIKDYGNFYPADASDPISPTQFFHSDNKLAIRRTNNNQDVEIYSGWSYVQNMIDSTPAEGIVTIDNDYTAESDDDALDVKKNITIDLNGHTLDRALKDQEDNGNVIRVIDNAILTITDNSTGPKRGTITGGNTEGSEDGGGIWIKKGCTLNIERAVISNNKSNSDGGAICNNGTLNIKGKNNDKESVIIQDNHAGDTGGAIYNTNTGSFNISYATIKGNMAENMGGALNVHMSADSSIKNCDIINNTSYDIAGAIRTHNGSKTFTISDSNINNNTSSDDGGGIYIEDSRVVLNDCHVDGNVSDNDSGGIKVDTSSRLEANNSYIQNNKASKEEGGGIKTYGITTLKGCTVKGNSSEKEGGGIYNDNIEGSEGDLTIKDCTITDNTSSHEGGGIYSDWKLQIEGNTTISNNKASKRGGGIYYGRESNEDNGLNISGTLVVESNTGLFGNDIYFNNLSGDRFIKILEEFNKNDSRIGLDAGDQKNALTKGYKGISGDTPACFKAPEGLGFVVDNKGEVKFKSSWKDLQKKIDETDNGGTLELDQNYTASYQDDRLKIKDNKKIIIDLKGYTINRNKQYLDGDGHVIEVEKGSTLTITDSHHNNNGVITGGRSKRGGAFYINEGAKLYFEYGTIKDNYADVDGGAIYNKGFLNMTGGVIQNNTADDTAGAIYNHDDGKFTIQNVTIEGNFADNNGGAFNIHLDDNSSIKNCKIQNNISGNYGGAIRMAESGKKLTIENTDITGNRSGDDGGGIYVERGTVEMTGGSVSNNMSNNDSGGIKVTDNTKFIGKDIKISNNTAMTEEGGGIKLFGDVSLEGCEISGNSAAKEGGGICVAVDDGLFSSDTGVLKLKDCKVTGNKTSSYGGGIYVLGKLSMEGTAGKGIEITGNTSGKYGGGIYYSSSGNQCKAKGLIKITGNKASDTGDNYYADSSRGLAVNQSYNMLEINGALLDGTQIGVKVSGNNGTVGAVTQNYSKYNSATEPSNYFFADEGYQVTLKSGEAYIGSNWSELVSLIKKAKSGDTIKLEKDYAGTANDDALTIDAKRNITIDLNGHIINRGGYFIYTSQGHVFRVLDNATLTIKDSSGINQGVITGGNTYDGGAIDIDGNSTVNIEGGTIRGNKAVDCGGAVYVNKGTLNVNGGVIQGNSANKGGAIFLDGADMGKLCLSGGVITNNTASNKAGAIFADEGSGRVSVLNVQGSPVVKNNSATKSCNNVYIAAGVYLGIVGSLGEACQIGIDKSGDEGIFTSGYFANNGNKDPSKYFSSSKGYSVYLISNEAALGAYNSGETSDYLPFLDEEDRINTNEGSLSGANWMAGVSGERVINDINMPVTHDSGMNNIESKWFDWTTWVPFGIGHKLAKTQIEYIDEQMTDGYRKFDLRLNPLYKEGHWYGYTWSDDGKNLYICHGKTSTGTYQALDDDDEYLSFNKILEWSKDFLRKHPTETIILELSHELDVDYQNAYWENETYARAGRILESVSKQINPSTGESYLYKEADSDSYLNEYTHIPTLGECRGKIVICSKKPDLTGGYQNTDKYGIKKCGGQRYEIGPDEKIDETKTFYNNLQSEYGTPGSPVKLSTDVNEKRDYVWSFGLNCTNQENIAEYLGRRAGNVVGLTDTAPYEYALTVNEALFGAGKLFDAESDTDNNKRGEYLGWVSMDRADSKYGENVWKTNFWDELTNSYKKVTVKSDIDTTKYPDQVFEVLVNSEITIPDNIYKGLEGKYLSHWKDNAGNIYHPGEKYKVTDDVTFTAVWLTEGKIPIRIEWNDGDNADNKRANKINVNVQFEDGTPSTVTLGVDTEYSSVIDATGKKVSSVTPDWDLITDGTYASNLSYDSMAGYIITLSHTPVNSKTNIAGTISWVDNDNKSNLRPARITVELYENDEATPVQTTTVTPDTDGKWSYQFADMPVYKNGEKINYSIKTPPIDNYSTDINGYNITNVLVANYRSVDGLIYWDDNYDAEGKRPDYVTIHLLANGAEKEEKTLEKPVLDFQEFSFVNLDERDEQGNTIKYTVTQDMIDNYDTTIQTEDDGSIVIVNKLRREQKEVLAYSTDEDCTTEVAEPKITPKTYDNLYDVEGEVSVEADIVDTHDFLGWYQVEETENDKVKKYGKKLSDSTHYSFTVEENTKLAAVYEKKAATLNVYSSNEDCTKSVVNPEVTPSGSIYLIGTLISATAKNASGYKFVGWYEVTGVEDGKVTSYGKLLNANNTYSFEINEDTQIVAVYEEEESVTKYEFIAYSTNKECKAKVIEPTVSPKSKDHQYDESTHIKVNANTKYGYEFVGWYEVVSVEQGKVSAYGDLISKEEEYEFDLNNDTEMVAVYQAMYTANMRPTPREGLVADKISQVLVKVPKEKLPEGYTMVYALGTSDTIPPLDTAFSKALPRGYNEGTYYVWYMPDGDDYHDDFPAECFKVTIAPGHEEFGYYEDVPVIPGVVRDITGTDEAPNEKNPNDASIGNVDDLHFEEEDVEQGINLWVYVILIDPSKLTNEEKAKIKRESGEYEIGAYYDIRVYAKVGNDHSCLLKECAVPVQVDFRPLAFVIKDNRSYGMVRLHEGTTTFIEAVYDKINDRMSFLSDKYSTYALVYKDNEEPPVPPGPTPPGPTPVPSGDVPSGGTKVKPAKTGDDISIVYFFNLIIDSLF